jgi:hypothetical protein
MIKKGCAWIAVLLAAVFGGYLWLLREIEFPANLILAAFAALGLLMLVSSLKQVLFGSGDLGALKRALKNEPLQDGAVEAVSGPIAPLGDPLIAPFSGLECVAYEYDAKKPAVSDEDGASRESGSAMAGLALTPSVIRSSRGTVRLLGFCLLTEFPELDLEEFGTAPQERARSHLASTAFEQVSLAKIGAFLSQLDSVMADDDGSVRKDWLMEKREAIDLSQARLSEKLIAPGEIITAVGIWDPVRGGLVPQYGGKKTMISLRPGAGELAVAAASKRPWALLVFSVIWCAFVHGIIYLALTHGM